MFRITNITSDDRVEFQNVSQTTRVCTKVKAMLSRRMKTTQPEIMPEVANQPKVTTKILITMIIL